MIVKNKKKKSNDDKDKLKEGYNVISQLNIRMFQND